MTQPPTQESKRQSFIIDVLQFGVPWVFIVTGGTMAIFAITSNASDTVKISFIGAAASAFTAAAGLTQTPTTQDKPKTKTTTATGNPEGTEITTTESDIPKP